MARIVALTATPRVKSPLQNRLQWRYGETRGSRTSPYNFNCFKEISTPRPPGSKPEGPQDNAASSVFPPMSGEQRAGGATPSAPATISNL
jgi:hypothetical protein